MLDNLENDWWQCRLQITIRLRSLSVSSGSDLNSGTSSVYSAAVMSGVIAYHNANGQVGNNGQATSMKLIEADP